MQLMFAIQTINASLAGVSAILVPLRHKGSTETNGNTPHGLAKVWYELNAHLEFNWPCCSPWVLCHGHPPILQKTLQVSGSGHKLSVANGQAEYEHALEAERAAAERTQTELEVLQTELLALSSSEAELRGHIEALEADKADLEVCRMLSYSECCRRV